MAKVFTITEGLENMGAMKTGGQGSVYKGRRIGQIITAIKILPTPIHSETSDDKNYTDFQNEVQKLKKVNEQANPHVVTILSSGITDSGNFPFIEMEYIDGPDLEDLLKPPHDPVFTIKEVLKVAEQLSNALAHCHKVDVKHGDVKSNNVKFNSRTGNYMLLDFGLALMSDEERRSSMRHAGAIEFMAPEQNAGQMLLETDVYSFGVILYELLAGTVPFPLKDKGETNRNTVMVAHMETPPPDVLVLRKEALPGTWSEEKKEHEMHVPEWLVSLIYKCLEKKPADRFPNGMELCEYIVRNSIITASKKEWIDERVTLLQQENERLMREKEQLQLRLMQYQKQSTEPDIASSAVPLTPQKSPTFAPSKQRGWFARNAALVIITGVIAASALLYFFVIKPGSDKPLIEPGIVKQDTIVPEKLSTKNTKDKNAENKDVSTQLNIARVYLVSGGQPQALAIYKDLAQQEVPEAMYQYGNLALQNRNPDITCIEAFELLTKAADAGYAPAKRTTGFLYAFADSTDILQQNNYYDKCSFTGNVSKGSKLLMEATLAGDTIAGRYLDELKAARE